MSYTPWDNNLFDPATWSAFQESVSRMQADDVHWVALNVFEFQADLAATAIAPDYSRWSTDLASVDRAVQELHSRGVRVLLKPNVDVVSGDWRGDIPGTNAWFDDPQGYKAFVSRWAAWAQARGVEGLCIGTEFEDAQWNSTKWRETIGLARTAGFSGWLTYAANWTSYDELDWWDALDYIGIDAYFPLTGDPDPTLAQLRAGWQTRVGEIGAWLASLAADDRKQVLFTEIGYRSLDGANMAPYAWSPYGTDDVDLQEQADCYAATFAETWDLGWLDGYYWWNWETNPGAGGYYNDYTPQNKPAELVLRNAYTPEPATVLLLAAGLAAILRGRRRRR